MKGSAAGPLPSDQNAFPGEEQLAHENDQRWSVRRSILFIMAVNVVLWATIVLGVRELI